MTEPKELARLTKHSASNIKLGLLKKPGGGISDEDEVAGILLDEHAPGSYEAPKERTKPKVAIRYTEIRKLKFMTINLLRESLREFGKKKRGGPDGLTSEMLSNLPDKTLTRLLTIIKAALCMSYSPTIWIEGEVIFIPKPSKDNYMEPATNDSSESDSQTTRLSSYQCVFPTHSS